ncbi:nucleotide exchange factor GrpE [Salibacter sp.]|jgi:molecular chaperone GrpE|uniref:nucleotide exchange factor GrpE n=1 Tax=Salibacter sp. TaxID=2010995 RepID=UPI002870983B|nr:nucleotide exchange factor GrpE [Salibacter sp.]MDR9399641.1 nucleotide exchange factor GrpE [Salibacter sp.]MDR9487337.1 nucleotide exchange factor GrpE [Salibacter sp.]
MSKKDKKKQNTDNEKDIKNEEQSAQNEQTAEKAVDEKETDNSNGSDQKEEKKEPTWEDKYNELNDRYLRLYSEFENFRRRTAKERVEMMNNAGSDMIKEVLPVLDDMERAIESNKDSDDIESIKEGFNLVHNKLFKTLEGKGLKPMNSIGEKFDPETADAIAKIPAPEKKMKGKVVDVVEKGYYLNDSILRYAKVVVGE